MNETVIGSCSLCGGEVTVPTYWMSVEPAIPTCRACGATAAPRGPVIKMARPSEVRSQTRTADNTD